MIRTMRVPVAVLLVLAHATSASAQPAPPPPDDPEEIEMDPQDPPPAPPAPIGDPKLAQRLAAAALVSSQKGDYLVRAKRVADARPHFEAAVAAYEQAIAANDSDAALYFELAIVEEKLDRVIPAINHHKHVIASTTAKPDLIAKATKQLAVLMGKVAVITVAVKPEGATIRIDGAEIGKAPLAQPIIVVPGVYKLAFEADGYRPGELEVSAEAGTQGERTFELEAIPVIFEKPVVDPPPVVVAPPKKPPTKLPLYLGAGAALALGVTSTITGLLAVGEHNTFTAPESPNRDRIAARDAGRRLALISDLTMLGALGAGAFTAYWYVFKYRPAQRKFVSESVAPKATLVPWVQPEGAGIAAVGSF
jgi:hypothetical protein